jgi:DNA primase
VSERIDTGRLNADHPIEEVVASYGVALRLSGRSLRGRCPFHDDRGRPNLYACAPHH